MLSLIKNRGIAFKLIFLVISSSSLIFFIIFGYDYIISRTYIEETMKKRAEDATALTINKLDIVLKSIEKVPTNLAYILEGITVDEDNLKILLRSEIENHPEIYGATVAFEPYAFDGKSKYFAPYYYKKGDKIDLSFLGGESYNYFDLDWYRIPKELGKPVWSEPYFDRGGGNIVMSTYSVPFYKYVDGKKKLSGIVTADVSLTWLQNIVSSVKIAETGYAFLISKKGTIVTHPLSYFVMHETVFSVAEKYHNPQLTNAAKEMVAGKSGMITYNSIVTGKPAWLIYAPLTSSGWSLGVYYPKEELTAEIKTLNKTVLLMGITGIFFLFAITALIARSITRPIISLADTTKDIAKGNLDGEIPQINFNDEIGVLAHSFDHMRRSLKKHIQDLTNTTATKEKMESELKIAHNIQMGIIPKVFPPFPNRHELDIYAILEPAKEVGGDFYDFFFIDDKHLCLVIGDVSGKGVPAALFMAVTKTLIKLLAKESGMTSKTLERANNEVCVNNKECVFVTVFCGILNTETGTMTYTNGGHNPPLIIRKTGNVETLRSGKSKAVGISNDAKFETAEVTVNAGDTILMYTDGVTEAINKKTEMFSEERLKKSVSKHRKLTATNLVHNILKDVREYSLGMAQEDDITLLSLRLLPSDEATIDTLTENSIVLKNDVSEITKLSDFVRAFGLSNRFSEKFTNDLNLALEEIVSNSIFYGHDDKGEHLIKVSAGLIENEVILKVEDDGKPFNPFNMPDPDTKKSLKERRVGGLGIYFAKKTTDTHEYKRVDDKNVIILKKFANKKKKEL